MRLWFLWVLNIMFGAQLLLANSSPQRFYQVHLLDCPQVQNTEQTSVIVTELLSQSLLRLGTLPMLEGVALKDAQNENALAMSGAVEAESIDTMNSLKNFEVVPIRGKCFLQNNQTILKVQLENQSWQTPLSEEQLENQILGLAFLMSGRSEADFEKILIKKRFKQKQAAVMSGPVFGTLTGVGQDFENEFEQSGYLGTQVRFVWWGANHDFEIGGIIPGYLGEMSVKWSWWTASHFGLVNGFGYHNAYIEKNGVQKYALNTIQVFSGIEFRTLDFGRLQYLLGYQNGSLALSGEYNQNPVIFQQDKLISKALNQCITWNLPVAQNWIVSAQAYWNVDLLANSSQGYEFKNNKMSYNYSWSESHYSVNLGWRFGND